jgi:hypothetical protein
MSITGMFRRIDRKYWFLCSQCLMNTNHDTVKSVFFYNGPPELYLGRPMFKCPRCESTNTRSFLQIKREGAESTIWGLERLVKKHPRSHFEVKGGHERGAKS